MTSQQTKSLLDLCIKLSAERDREMLLSHILDTAMELTGCDGGTLYLLEEDGLHFCRMVTRSLSIRQGGHDAPIAFPPVPLSPFHVCARSVLEARPIAVKDVYHDGRFDFSGAARYDNMTGYATHSMLVVPMTNDRGTIIGVLQLINAMDPSGSVIPFPEETEVLVAAMASQAAVCLTNMHYADQVRGLLDSLVGALSTAIDERTPYNANHTRNMVRYGSAFLDWLKQNRLSWQFTEEQRRAFLMSVWLHDVGKLAVPLAVMDKESRLADGIETVRARFYAMKLLQQIQLLQGHLTPEEAERLDQERENALNLIERVNKAGFLPDSDLAAICNLATRTYVDEQGESHPWLTEHELECLSVRKGTLTAAERRTMEGHVVVTDHILSQVAFPDEYEQVPIWASAHHELLNGTGYPNHSTEHDIPREVRLLTILDVFDALTARDRPYKPPMPVEKALSILHSMAEEGSIDREILALFEQSRAWEELT